MKILLNTVIVFTVILLCGCLKTGGPVVTYTTVSNGREIKGIGKNDLAQIAEINKAKKKENTGLKSVIQGTTNYSVEEYLRLYPEANEVSALDYRVGGYDIIDVVVYEEPDISRKAIQVSANGYISFPFIDRVKVDGLTSSEIESMISRKLVEGNYILNAHVSVTVTDYKSKQYKVLGAVSGSGIYPLEARERVLDAIARSGGIDFENGGKEAMVIRTLNTDTEQEEKIVIRINLPNLLKGGDQLSNLLLHDKDVFYVPKFDNYYILGQAKSTGSFPYQEREITLVEAIGIAGGFTETAARNRVHILRLDKNGNQIIIIIKMDEILKGGQRGKDFPILPGDVIVVPESWF
ncbi:MAG: hypothetical protein GY795_04285 [Desulfobacterales bacterium]|nr:hypothetical protein [Desulfobacterales bacterium]